MTRKRLRGEILGAEYLGTTQIVVVETEDGIVKARIPADALVATGETWWAWPLSSSRLSLFDQNSGRAIETALLRGGANG